MRTSPPPSRRVRRRRIAALAALALTGSLVTALNVGTATAVTGPLPIIEDFEGSVPITTANPGIFPFGSDAASTPKLAVVAAADRPGAAAGNHALDVPYTVSRLRRLLRRPGRARRTGAAYAGFSFWVKGTGTGQKIEYEIKDGGADGEHSELWQGFFTDANAGWTADQRAVRQLRQAHRLPADRRPDRRRAEPDLDVGLRDQPAGSASGDLVFDDFAALRPRPAAGAAVDQATYLVERRRRPRRSAVTVSTPDGSPLAAPVSVALHRSAAARAVAGTDFTANTGTLTSRPAPRPARPSTSPCTTIAEHPGAESKTIPVTLTATGADPHRRRPPTVVINAHGLPYLEQRIADRAAGRRPDVADDAGRQGRSDDPGRAGWPSATAPTSPSTGSARCCPAAARRRPRTPRRPGPT